MIKSLKLWLKTAKPNGRLLFWQTIISILTNLTIVIAAIPAAKIISCVSVANFPGAIKFVQLELGLCFIYGLFSICALILENVHCRKLKMKIETKLFNHIATVSPQNLKPFSKQKIVNTLTNSVNNIVNFLMTYVNFWGNLIQLIFVFAILIWANLSLAFMLLGICGALLLIYSFITTLEDHARKYESDQNDFKENLVLDLISGAQLSNDLNFSSQLLNKINEQTQKTVKSSVKTRNILSIKNIWVYILLNSAVCFLTIYLIRLLRLDNLTLTLFVLIIPYLTEALNKSLLCFKFVANAKIIKNDCEKVETISSLTGQDMINFGNNLTDYISGSLLFNRVTFENNNQKFINRFTASFVKNTQNNCIFSNIETKNAFLALLNRTSKPTSGTITLDDISIYDFSPETYSHNIAFVNDNPYFFTDTILSNLMTTGSTKKSIIDALKNQKVYKLIELLPQGINSSIGDIKDDFALYLISIARALLTKSEVIVFDGFPMFSPDQTQKLKSNLFALSKNHTIIVCTQYDLNLINARKFIIK